MTSHGDYSPEARERAGHTVTAADVLAENAERIHGELPEVPEAHVLVAVVSPTHQLSGMHHVAQDQLIMKVPELETSGGWAMVFTPGVALSEVRRRIDEMRDLAQRRADAIDRILARREQG